jgi:glycosyltransferase involved in cell wall biosynthesis
MTPLVSILIPAYNAERWIAQTIQSAIAQTWSRKEIIIVDDGSSDRTRSVAQQFASATVKIVSQENQGAAVARNKAFELCRGDYVQWLDADDLLSPSKITEQIEAATVCHNQWMLLSCGWGRFYYKTSEARFIPSALWCDLTPAEWLLRKIGQNLHMPPATWLVSRELTLAAGPWDARLSLDDDGEYFCRVILASEGIRFAPGARVFYRISGFSSLSTFDYSEKKLASQLLSTQLHVQYIRSLEESERVRNACLDYLQRRFSRLYPEHHSFVEQLQHMAATLGGQLQTPHLPWKYSWMQKLFGYAAAKMTRESYNRIKWSLWLAWRKAVFYLGGERLTSKS